MCTQITEMLINERHSVVRELQSVRTITGLGVIRAVDGHISKLTRHLLTRYRIDKIRAALKCWHAARL